MLGNFVYPWSIDNHLRLSLEELGHETHCQQEGPPGTSRAVDAAAVVAAARARQPDMFLWLRTWAMSGDRSAMVAALRELGCPTASFTLDLFAPLHRGREVGLDPWWQTDVVFSADGGSDEFWRERGVRHCWVRPGVYHAECLLVEPGDADRCDVLFVGQAEGYHHEWPHRLELVRFLRDSYGDRFRLLPGSGPPVRGLALNRAYAGARVVVGDTLCPGWVHRDCWSDRVPETLGRGGFLVMPEVPGMAARFRDGEHLVYHRPGELGALGSAIDRWLLPEHAGERERIRRAGHEHVKATATYLDVAREILAGVAELGRART